MVLRVHLLGFAYKPKGLFFVFWSQASVHKLVEVVQLSGSRISAGGILRGGAPVTLGHYRVHGFKFGVAFGQKARC